MIAAWHNKGRVARRANAERPLTHSLDLGEEGLAMQATRICSIADCGKPVRGKGYCAGHYQRWLNHGDPKAGRLSPGASCSAPDCDRPNRSRGLCGMHVQRLDRTGSLEREPFVKAACSVVGCERPVDSWGWCNLHYERWVRNGDPLIILPNPASLSGSLNPKWQGEDIGYGTAHERVRRSNGPASRHSCLDCGRPAADWSYDHLDPNERVTADGLRFSAKIEHYEPRCKPCHWRKDHPSGKRASG